MATSVSFPIVIRIAVDEDRSRWDNYVSTHSQGVAYQYWGWLDAVSKAYGFKGYRIIAERENTLVGIFSMVHVIPPLGKGKFVSLPYCDLGGGLADSAEIESLLIAESVKIACTVGVKEIAVRSFEPLAASQENITGHPHKVRLLMKLPGDSEQLLAGFKAKLRSQIKKPLRDGLSVSFGGLELLDEFYSVFSENMRDLGSPVHSKKWIASVLKAYDRNTRVGIVLMPDGTPAAAGIILLHPITVSIPWASSLRRFNRWNPNMLLYWELLKFAADNGHQFFDFGRSTPDEGTYRFKKQWGANPTPLYWPCIDVQKSGNGAIRTEVPSTTNGHSRLRRGGEWIIRQLPIPMAIVLGSATRKYISL